MKMRKSVGERMACWGTPKSVLNISETVPSTTTAKERLVRKFFMIELKRGVIPKEGSFARRAGCHTLSKAFEISRAVMNVSPWLSSEESHVSVRRARRSAVERPRRKPYCESDKRDNFPNV
jgi:hypothetical protein